MTHSLHRTGSVESLKGDYVFLCMPSKHINDLGSGPKLQHFLKIALKYNPVSVGDARTGTPYLHGGLEQFLKKVEDRSVVQAVFNNKDAVIAMLRDLKEEDLGLSVVLAGLTDEVQECCSKTGLKLHAAEHSLGIWGKTEKLPPKEILDIGVMCGHGLVSVYLINELIEKVKKGIISVEKAAEELSKPCVCGIFNTDRAAKLIAEIVNK